jgi:hypothetical protein
VFLVLPCVDQYLDMPLAQSLAYGGSLDELRPCADDRYYPHEREPFPLTPPTARDSAARDFARRDANT